MVPLPWGWVCLLLLALLLVDVVADGRYDTDARLTRLLTEKETIENTGVEPEADTETQVTSCTRS